MNRPLRVVAIGVIGLFFIALLIGLVISVFESYKNTGSLFEEQNDSTPTSRATAIPQSPTPTPRPTGKSGPTQIAGYVEKLGPTAARMNTPHPTSTIGPTNNPAPWPDCGPGVRQLAQIDPTFRPSEIFSPYPDMSVSQTHAKQAQEYLRKGDYLKGIREIDSAIEVDPDKFNFERVGAKISIYDRMAEPAYFSAPPNSLEEYEKDSPQEYLEAAMEILDAFIARLPQYCRDHSLLPYHYRDVHLWRAYIQVRIYELASTVHLDELNEDDLCQELEPIYADYKIAGNLGLGINQRLERRFYASKKCFNYHNHP